LTNLVKFFGLQKRPKRFLAKVLGVTPKNTKETFN